jgi:hypothetical protein
MWVMWCKGVNKKTNLKRTSKNLLKEIGLCAQNLLTIVHMASNGSCCMVTCIVYKNHLLEACPTQKPEDHGTPNVDIHCFILFDHVQGPKWIKLTKIAFGWGPGHIRLHTTLEGLWPHYMVLEVYWDGLLNTCLMGSHNFMVMALGSCVKWP